MRIAILIVNYFSHRDVQGLLDSVARCSHPELLVSVVDNSEDLEEYSDLTAIVDGRYEFEVIVSRAPKNLGYGAGNNLAYSVVAHQDFEVVLIANPDCRVLGGSMNVTAQQCAATKDLVGVRVQTGRGYRSGASRLNPWTGTASDRVDRPRHGFDYPDGHFMFIARSTWSRLGGFDPAFFLYCEELDVAIRSRLFGSTVRSTTQMTVLHAGGGTTNPGSDTKSTTTLYHAARSKVILYRKHSGLSRYLMFFVTSRLVLASSLFIRGRVNDSRAVAFGVIAGLRHPRVTDGPAA